MRVRKKRFAVAGAVLALWFAGAVQPLSGASKGRTGVLEEFAHKFRERIYPLLSRSVNGCEACHNPRSANAFQILDSPGATFSLLLERDLFDPQDPMAIPSRLSTDDGNFRMPKAGSLAESEIETIVGFFRELSEELRNDEPTEGIRRDERFPDSLLLPYDGEARSDRAQRRMSYFQLRKSFETLFGKDWLAASGDDPFNNKAHALGGADFRGSFDESRTITASYISVLQGIAREVARRFVSAPTDALFDGFEPDVFVRESRKTAAQNVRTLYKRILFVDPPEAEVARALRLVRALQAQSETERTVRFTLSVDGPDGRRDSRQVDVTLVASDASVSRHSIDQSLPVSGDSWARVGNGPFRFEAANPDHFVRLLARPGNHVTAWDAAKFVRVEDGFETGEPVVIDNLDPECTLSGEWEPVEKEGERSRAGEPKKKYDMDLDVVGSNHLEHRNVDNRLGTATVSPRIPQDGEYNLYLSWPRIPRATASAFVEVHSATPSRQTVADEPLRQSSGFATAFLDQTESTLDERGETQWELVHREVLLEGPGDYVEVSNRGVNSTEKVIVADAVKFVPLDGGPAIVVDNSSEEGFEASDGWAPDQLVRNLPGRGRMHGEDILHYPPAKSGEPLEDNEIDPGKQVWARYRPVQGGKIRPGWYSVHVWTPGGHTHANWVRFDIHGSAFAPIVSIEAAPVYNVGETAVLNAAATYHPQGELLAFEWTHNATDLDLRLEGATTAAPRFRVPSLKSPRAGWAGLIEALLQRPEFLMPLDGAGIPPPARLARVALDLAGRIPTTDEFRRLERDGQIEPLIDSYLASDDFKEFFFHRARDVFRSRGTAESDEPARLWTYIATNDLSYRELFTADYTVSTDWKKAQRRPVHGPTGFLTMKGYMEGKPGLPKFTYPAQVLTFALGVQFEVSDAVEDTRDKVVSTTDPNSICYSCHKLLTPLAFQRERWDVHGHYRAVDGEHQPIDDSDRGVVPDYAFKGTGLGAFASQVVRKERFVRAFVNLHHDMLFHRSLRVYEDQRDEYRELYEFAVANELRIRPLLRRMILMRLRERSGGT